MCVYVVIFKCKHLWSMMWRVLFMHVHIVYDHVVCVVQCVHAYTV